MADFLNLPSKEQLDDLLGKLSVNFVRLITETKPTNVDSVIKEGDTLLMIDEADSLKNEVYMYRNGWRLL